MGAISPLQFSPHSAPLIDKHSKNAPAHAASTEVPHGQPADSLESTQDTRRIVQPVVYERASLSTRFQEIAARLADMNVANATASDAQSQQLSFDFNAKIRAEALLRFGQRIQDVAGSLNGASQSSFLEISLRVALRFHVSLDISSSALSGFSSAAFGVRDTGDLIDRLIALSEKLLSAGDKVFDDILSLLDGTSPEQVKRRLNALFEKLFRQFFPDYPGGGSKTLPDTNLTSSSVKFSLQLEFKFSFELSIQDQLQVRQSDPVTFDLDGDGFELTRHTQGAQFDILGNGQKARTAFVTGGDAFLALDRNGDGVIGSGKELFGDQHGAANGYEELRKLDSNGDGVINRHDRDYGRLLLFRDNGDGVSGKGELVSLDEAGIAEINLGYHDVNVTASGGNHIGQAASFTWDDGRRGNTADTILNYVI